MKALASSLSGVCAFRTAECTRFVALAESRAISVEVAHLLFGAVDDWEEVEAGSDEEILAIVRDRHLQARALLNIESCILGASPDLTRSLLLEVEDLLKVLGSRDPLAASLLAAPLRHVEAIKALVDTCWCEGLGATAGLLDHVLDMQPLLRRLTDAWLAIPDELYRVLPDGRAGVWRNAASSGTVLRTLHFNTFGDAEQAWASLAFRYRDPGARVAVARVAKALAQALFAQSASSKALVRPIAGREFEEAERAIDRRPEVREGGRFAFEQALRQVEAIAAAVAEGRDANARRYLRDLLRAQAGYIGGADHAVKSLCNIAQQCAEMFRTDFEFECLQTAMGIKPGDAWTLVQLADHFKRVGNFEEAIRCLQQAQAGGQERVAKSSLADVYVQMGRFDEAIAIYDGIPDTQWDPAIRGAKADALRRWGYLDAAAAEYGRIVEDGLSSHRVVAGLAEIAKLQGNLELAQELYGGLVNQLEIDPRASVVYRMALANVLVRRGNLLEAYNRLDEAVQMRPFARQARAYRAAVAGLLGRAEEAVRELPIVGQSNAFNEWVSDYVRGLLLLLLDRYADARVALMQRLADAKLDRDADRICRLGAAVCFLRTREGVPGAARLLEGVPPMNDVFADSIRAALKYHVAVALRHKSESAFLREQLRPVQDPDLLELVLAIDQRDWRRAWSLEVRSLLRLAA